ncbi:type II toxin-antitoxin system HicB family antitoxin [Candidatus Electronema sp. PJ]|uniref:type II toxin-antitoxin system HicB family antitoxin n=1 Tax=Candidatus Electronema sp. PJ TaxID=3401572 RepID=UPI003AA7BB0B
MELEIIFEIREDESEGGFIARALGCSIVTQADTWEELRTNVRDAIRCHFDEGQVFALSLPGKPM